MASASEADLPQSHSRVSLRQQVSLETGLPRLRDPRRGRKTLALVFYLRSNIPLALEAVATAAMPQLAIGSERCPATASVVAIATLIS